MGGDKIEEWGGKLKNKDRLQSEKSVLEKGQVERLAELQHVGQKSDRGGK